MENKKIYSLIFLAIYSILQYIAGTNIFKNNKVLHTITAYFFNSNLITKVTSNITQQANFKKFITINNSPINYKFLFT